jgi:3-oxosteroid 1-dehydrogenase
VRSPDNTPFDVVVVGSGASALMAALVASAKGAEVVVLEKSGRFGGSTALSGGQLWIPNNRLQKEAGIRDSPEDAFRYVKQLSAGRVSSRLIHSFVENAPTALDFLTKNTPLVPELRDDLPDYHPEWSGASKGGRTIDPGLFDGTKLGPTLPRLRQNPQYHLPGGIHVTSAEFERLMRGEEIPELKGRPATTLSFGEALVGAMLKGLMDRGVSLLSFHRGVKLTKEHGTVNGVEVEFRGRKKVVGARRGVVLAAGGFEWNPRMKRKMLGAPSENSAGCPSNTGDGINMGVEVGGSTALMDEAWWFTLILKPGEERGWLTTSERTLPHSIMVNIQGRRFANEASNYNDLAREMLRMDGTTYDRPNIPAFLVFDSEHRRKYSLVDVPPGNRVPSWVASAASISALAKKLRVNGRNLEEAVRRFNLYASSGSDPDFGRGDSAYDRHWGDPKAKHPTLGPVSRPPFYAVRVLAGDIGTKGGLQIDPWGRVLDARDKPIPGLFSAGNNAASVMGPGYAASGATLGPCITFGYLAGATAASI